MCVYSYEVGATFADTLAIMTKLAELYDSGKLDKAGLLARRARIVKSHKAIKAPVAAPAPRPAVPELPTPAPPPAAAGPPPTPTPPASQGSDEEAPTEAGSGLSVHDRAMG